MRSRGRSAAALLGAAAIVGGVLSGCGEPVVPPIPTPTATAVFASDDEALAAAEAAYTAYLEVSRVISADGGRDPERIEGYAAGELLEVAYEGFASLRDQGWRIEGQAHIVKSVLQFASEVPGPEAVGAYFCVDFAGVDVLNADGQSVVSPDRPDLQAFAVIFDVDKNGAPTPSGREAWEVAVCG